MVGGWGQGELGDGLTFLFLVALPSIAAMPTAVRVGVGRACARGGNGVCVMEVGEIMCLAQLTILQVS